MKISTSFFFAIMIVTVYNSCTVNPPENKGMAECHLVNPGTSRHGA